MALNHLVYLSNRKETCTPQEIDNILASCKKNNGKLDITGVLLYSDQKFVQYLEGSQENITSLYEKIKGDDRHNQIFLISNSPIENRIFPSWEMGAKNVNFHDVSFRTDISDEDNQVFDQILKGAQTNRAMEVIKKLFV